MNFNKSFLHILRICCIVFFLGFLSSCVSVKPLNIGKVQDLKPENFSTRSITFSFHVNIKNPNNFAIKISKVHLKASLDGKELGKVSKVSEISIPGNSDASHDVKVTIDLNESSAGMSGLFNLYQQRNSMKFNGFIKARALFIGKKINVVDKNLFQLMNY